LAAGFQQEKDIRAILVRSPLLSLRSNRFIQLVSARLLSLPSQNGNCHGQQGHGVGEFFTEFEQNATKQQST
jgi:hypothetical protein